MWMKQYCESRSEIRSNQSCLSKTTNKITFLHHSSLENMKIVKAELPLDVWGWEAGWGISLYEYANCGSDRLRSEWHLNRLLMRPPEMQFLHVLLYVNQTHRDERLCDGTEKKITFILKVFFTPIFINSAASDVHAHVTKSTKHHYASTSNKKTLLHLFLF